MKSRLAVSFVAIYVAALELLGTPSAGNPLAPAIALAQEESSSQVFSEEQLDNLLAPIALYPDPLLAQVLLAATFVDQVDEAARWLRAYNNPNAVDDQPWDVSVKAVAHYPSVLYMMSDQLDWTVSVGQAYVYQSADVMTSIQRLRAQAYSAGNLITNDQQQVVVDGDVIELVPAQPQYIYVPMYNPSMIYFGTGSYYGFYPPSIISFGPPLLIGSWLNHSCDWHRHRIYYHGWHGGGWIARSRPIIHITNIYVNNRYTNIQINRNVVDWHVNYNNLNRFNSIHRNVNYDNLIHDGRRNTGNANAGNGIIRRNVDVTDPRLDTYRGRPPQPAPGAVRPPLTGPTPQTPLAPPEPRRPTPPPQSRPPQTGYPAPQQPPRDIQRAPNTVFGRSPSALDPRATSQRGQESRARANQPATTRPVAPPNAPATRSVPVMPGRRP